MKPTRRLAATTTPEGLPFTLEEHDGTFCIRINGLALMHSKTTTSELHLGELAAERLVAVPRARVLIGGLGLGFTLRRVLERAGADAVIEVAELIPELVEWNRTFLAEVNGRLLDDPRVRVEVGDLRQVLAKAGRGDGAARYDAILIDIDNGPNDSVQKCNRPLYGKRGINQMAAALRPGGRAAIWSAGHDRAFAEKLARAGFNVEVIRAQPHAGARTRTYAIFVADLAAP